MAIKGYDINTVNGLIDEVKRKKDEVLTRNHNITTLQQNLHEHGINSGGLFTTFVNTNWWQGVSDKADEVVRRLEHVKQQNENDTPRFDEFSTIPEDVREFSRLVMRYATHLTSAAGMLGYPGGGWKNISLEEKTNLASMSGNKPALFSLLANQIGQEGSISEDQMSRIIELSIMNPDEKREKIAALGGEEKFIEEYFGNDAGAEARYKLSDVMHDFIDKEVRVKYSDLRNNPSELKRRYQSFGFSEVQYNDLLAKSGVDGVFDTFRQVEASKMLGVLLYSTQDTAQYTNSQNQQIKGHRMSVLFDTASYNIYSGVSVRVLNRVSPIGTKIKLSYNSEMTGTIFTSETAKTVQILRAQNTIIRLPDVLSQYQGTSGQKVEVTKSSVGEIGLFNDTLSTAKIDSDLKEAQKKYDDWAQEAGGEVASFIVSLLPAGSVGADAIKDLSIGIVKDLSTSVTKGDDLFKAIEKEYNTRKGNSLPTMPTIEPYFSEKYRKDTLKTAPNKLQDGVMKGVKLFVKKSELESALESKKRRKEDDTKINEIIANDGYVIIENGQVSAYDPSGTKK